MECQRISIYLVSSRIEVYLAAANPLSLWTCTHCAAEVCLPLLSTPALPAAMAAIDPAKLQPSAAAISTAVYAAAGEGDHKVLALYCPCVRHVALPALPAQEEPGDKPL